MQVDLKKFTAFELANALLDSLSDKMTQSFQYVVLCGGLFYLLQSPLLNTLY